MSNPPLIAEVILDEGLDHPLDYQIPEELQGKLFPGTRVKVPLRNRECVGTVLFLKATSPFTRLQKIRETVSDTPSLSPELLHLANWISEYYCSPLRKVLKVILPPGIRKETGAKTQLFIKSLLSNTELVTLCEKLRRKSPLQAAILDILLKAPKGILLSSLMEQAKSTAAP